MIFGIIVQLGIIAGILVYFLTSIDEKLEDLSKKIEALKNDSKDSQKN